MNLNDYILNTALLGTASKELPVAEFPEELQDTFRQLQDKAGDPEAAFYQMAALTLAYSRAGIEPQLPDNPTITARADKEELGYFSSRAGDLLLSLAEDRNRYLLLYAYRRAATCDKLIPPKYLPTLLAKAFERNNPDRKEEQRLLPQLSGKRGRWLLPLIGLPDWDAKANISWETASHEERKQLLTDTRRENPDAGLALLQAELKNESAAHRDELIQCLRETLNINDEPFLIELSTTDRSRNVRETVSQLLRGLIDSEQMCYCWGLLKAKIHYNKLLGWTYDKLVFLPEMKKIGLFEVSNIRGEKDHHYLLRQLVERVPLRFWCEFFDCEPEKAARKLAKNPPFPSNIELWRPIELFKDSMWAYYTLKERKDETLLNNLMGLLPVDLREDIPFKPQRDSSIPESWYNADGQTWGLKFSDCVFHRMLERVFYLTSEEAERIAAYMPDEMYPLFQKRMATTNVENSAIYHICQLLLQFMDLRRRIDTAFEPKQ